MTSIYLLELLSPSCNAHTSLGLPRGSKTVPSSSKSHWLGTCSDPLKLSTETYNILWDAQPRFCPVMCPIATGCWELLPTITRSRVLWPMKNETQNDKESKLKQMHPASCNHFEPDWILVRMSARFVSVGSHCTLIICAATRSHTQWKAIEFDFFLRVDSGWLLFLATDKLSALTWHGPSIGTTIISSLWRSPSINPVPVFIAENLDPKDDVLIDDCFLLYKRIGDLLRKIKTPVRDRQVTLSPARSESTSQKSIVRNQDNSA